MTLVQVLEYVASYGCHHVCVTGGEPLAQKECLEMLAALCDEGYDVSLETSGALDLSGVDARVVKIMDIKAPASGESGKTRLENLRLLGPHDEIKCVLASADDYEWAKRMLAEHRLDQLCEVLFAPVQGLLDPTQLAGWILRDRLPVRFQLQLHKLLWGAKRGT